MDAIVLDKISKSFHGKEVLKNFSAVFPMGETTCIMAPLRHLQQLPVCRLDPGEYIGIDDGQHHWKRDKCRQTAGGKQNQHQNDERCNWDSLNSQHDGSQYILYLMKAG